MISILYFVNVSYERCKHSIENLTDRQHTFNSCWSCQTQLGLFITLDRWEIEREKHEKLFFQFKVLMLVLNLLLIASTTGNSCHCGFVNTMNFDVFLFLLISILHVYMILFQVFDISILFYTGAWCTFDWILFCFGIFLTQSIKMSLLCQCRTIDVWKTISS